LKPITPCICGNNDLIIWPPSNSGDRITDLTSIEKIECAACGSIVYGCDNDAIDQWNAGDYDD